MLESGSSLLSISKDLLFKDIFWRYLTLSFYVNQTLVHKYDVLLQDIYEFKLSGYDVDKLCSYIAFMIVNSFKPKHHPVFSIDSVILWSLFAINNTFRATC